MPIVILFAFISKVKETVFTSNGQNRKKAFNPLYQLHQRGIFLILLWVNVTFQYQGLLIKHKLNFSSNIGFDLCAYMRGYDGKC